MLFNMKFWKKLGGFDENIFMYYEDDEICYRAEKLGLEMAIFPKSEFIHLCGKSCSHNLDTLKIKSYHLTWGKLYFRKIKKGGLKAKKLAIMFILRHLYKGICAVICLDKNKITQNLYALKGAFSFLFVKKLQKT